MWTFKFTGTPDKVIAAIQSDSAPDDPVEAAQHAQFQALASAQIPNIDLDKGQNGITVICQGQASIGHRRVTFSVDGVTLNI